jgi:hypothetical protein
MTRILYWNVQKFSANKIKGKTVADMAPAVKRLQHIKNVIVSNPPRPPDMVVIVEGTADEPSQVREFGAVLPPATKPAEGMLQLLTEIRQWLGESWCLVPPVPTGELGKCETVAVYYNSASLIFTGPYVYATDKSSRRYQVNKAMPATPDNVENLATYDPAWGQYLPKARNRSWATPGGAQVNEWQGAGQWDYGNLRFPSENNRRPFYTRMKEVNGNRTIKVVAVHTTPDVASAGTRNLYRIPDVATVGDNEVAVVVGDFNVDSFRGDPKFGRVTDLDDIDNPYERLVNTSDDGLGYRMLLNPCPPGTFHQHPNRKPYCLTLILRNKIKAGKPGEKVIATPYNANGVPPDAQHNVYPRFGYMGSYSEQTGGLTDLGAYDNVFVKYGPNLQPAPVQHNTTIVNAVVGKPYNQLAPPPVGVTSDLTSGLTQPSDLQQPIPQPGGINPGGNVNGFNDYENYGVIRSVSDHLAILFDV